MGRADEGDSGGEARSAGVRRARSRSGGSGSYRRGPTRAGRRRCDGTSRRRTRWRGETELMCRWLTYTGSPIALEKLLYEPENSLIDQSLHARYGEETVNGDGFGIGYYDDAGVPPAVFKDTKPAWGDRNLRELARHVRSPLFMAHV